MRRLRRSKEELKRLRRLADPCTPEGYANWKGTAGPGNQLKATIKDHNAEVNAKKEEI